MLKDQKDFLSTLNAHGVDYVVVGSHMVNAYGVPRLRNTQMTSGDCGGEPAECRANPPL